MTGFDDHHPEDSKQTGRGRPDIFGLNSIERCIVIEVKGIAEKKRVDPYLNFNEISDSQRRWLDWWVWDRLGAGYIGIGTYFGSPRQLWIIPWQRWVKYEYYKFQKDKVYKAPVPDIEQYFHRYKMIWIGGENKWQMPEDHPIAKIRTWYHDKGEWQEEHSFRFDKIDKMEAS